MDIVTFIVTYIVLWWLIFLMALPIGVKAEASPEIGHATSAPSNPNIGYKLLATSLITLAATYLLVKYALPKLIVYFAA